ncbi:MAG TPA: NADH-quinone oxidoreductase subunit NuoG [Burkholderiaceae bacterium]|nr:NADH-quinone oxidoreductase subunit NuoG [Burkholderiaceae bacterium]
MIEVEIDGRKVEVPEGSMLMEAANRLGIYVPHFCYHKKLTIAANCRMCLVEVEKAPKPLPACATPVAKGMIARTQSAYAKQAQNSVMEFLLINHPLDCPICDQGGECQLQDLAVGYGNSASRYTEPKRVVFHKYMGPLISAEEMTRCIHCTRCVRFGIEVAGVMELGMANRGEHSEILSFVGQSVNSELSGNMIDLCPVGALTSKPFRYEARPWELSRRKSISPHDSLGSNLIVQVKNNEVMRVLPLENEEINECWLSDRDRFSYEGLNAPDRLLRPMIKQDGQWREVDWTVALEYAAKALMQVKAQHGAAAIGALAWPGSTLEEMHLLSKVMRGVGSDNIDFRLRQSDFQADGVPWLGMKIADVGMLNRALLVGSFLRKDQPLLSARLRAATKRGCKVSVLHAVDSDLLMPVSSKVILKPSEWVRALCEIAVAIAAERGEKAPVDGLIVGEACAAVARSLLSGERKAILLGNAVTQHPQAAQLHAWAQWIADATGATLGVLTEGANTVGGYVARAMPNVGAGQEAKRGLNAREMMEQPRTAYLLWNVEPDYDLANPVAASQALQAADTVIACSAYRNGALDYADVMLPIGPFTETAGTFINCEGRVQSFNGTVRPAGEARPGWKVLRVLGNLLGLEGFEYETSDQVRSEAVPADVGALLSNRTVVTPSSPDKETAQGAAERITDVPIYFSDAIVRRSAPLQATNDAKPPKARASSRTLQQFGVANGDPARVKQGATSALLEVAVDETVADGAVHISAGHEATAALGPMFGPITLEAA